MRKPSAITYSHVAITGASGGLGTALAKAYAADAEYVSLAGRDTERLDICRGKCFEHTTNVDMTAFNVCDHHELRAWLENADKVAPLDVVILNAGVCSYPGDDLIESPEAVRHMMDTDATSAMVATEIAAEIMMRRGAGVIVLISSLAALSPLATCPAYSAAKAALRFFGLALGERLRGTGVQVCVVCPGYIDTPMTDALTGHKPFLWSADKAAGYIKRKIEKGAVEICFPFLLVLGVRLLDMLPHRIRLFFLKLFATS